ncbi:MAG: hypothetical protein KAT71_03810 [Gammaproteobacteria bacterium]|nr:hypothetical protein [Gammaproteobacteria bacterium]
MKTLIKTYLKNSFSFFLIATCTFGIGSTAFAATINGSGNIPVSVTGISDPVAQALANTFESSLINFYNQALEQYRDLMLETDNQIPATIEANDNQKTANEAMAKAIASDSDKAIQVAFGGVQAKDNASNTLFDLPAGDDVVTDNAKSSGLFFSSNDSFKDDNEEAAAGNAFFNNESLLGPETYSDKTDKQNALGYMAQLANFAPPPTVIRLGATFQVPIIDPKNPENKYATVGDKNPLSTSDIKNMQETLDQDPTYRSYKNLYRGLIAARSIYINNLSRSYQARVPQVDNKSAKQIRDERANRRLGQDYYKEMSTASPATVQRETLFVLADINSQLNAIRNQNERIIIMNSISGINQLTLGGTILNAQAQHIGKKVYCMDPEHKDDKVCTISTSMQIDSSGLQKQLGDLTGSNIDPSSIQDSK